MKIALTLCPKWNNLFPPISLGYLAAALQARNLATCIFDFNIELYNKNKANPSLWGHDFSQGWNDEEIIHSEGRISEAQLQEWAVRVIESKADMVGFTIFNSTRVTSLMLARKIKSLNSQIITIFGGPDCNRGYSGLDIIKRNEVDIVALGEGEQTIVEIADLFSSGKGLAGCKGLLFKKDGKLIDSGARLPIKDINALPYPDFSETDLELYKDSHILPILGSRGCVKQCNVCQARAFWNRQYRFRSGSSIFAEMKYQKEKFKNRGFFFCDCLINGNVKELDKLCRLLIEHGLNVFWLGDVVVSPLLTPELFSMMRKAGCYNLTFGVESGSQKVANDMNKHISLEVAERNIKDASAAGIKVQTNWIVGFPTETHNNFLETLHFIVRNSEYINRVNSGVPCVILPETPLYDNIARFGVNNRTLDWVCGRNGNSPSIRWERWQVLDKLSNMFPLNEGNIQDEIYEYILKIKNGTKINNCMSELEILFNMLKK